MTLDATSVCCPPPPCCPPASAIDGQVAVVEGDLAALDALIERYGTDAVAHAGANEYLRAACNELRDVINASDMPQFMKDEYLAQVNEMEAGLMQPVDPCCQHDVAGSGYGETCAAGGAEAVQDAATADTAAEAGGEATGGEPAGVEQPAGEPHAEGAGEAGGGGGAEGAGGGGGGDAQTSVEDAIAANASITRDPEDEETGGGGGGGTAGGGNIMMRIARKMGQAQDKLLQNALSALDAMELAQSGDGKPTDAFATHQSEFTAYMQLFTITANATSTALKALGEGCTAVARKQ